MALFIIHHRKGRTREYDIQITTAGGVDLVLQADDEVLVEISRGETSILSLNSYTVEPGGSTVTFTPDTNDACLTIGQEDTNDMETGAYDMEIAVVDQSHEVGSPPQKAVKHTQQGAFFLHPTSGQTLSDEQSSSSSSPSSSSSSSSS